MTKMRMFFAALAVSVLAVACSKGSVGVNPGSSPVLVSDPVTGTYSNVAPTGELAVSQVNSLQYNAQTVQGTVKATPGTVSGVQLISQDNAHVVFLQVSNNSNIAIAVDSGVGLTPVLEYSLPAAAATATNYPGTPVQFYDPVLPKVYFDAGISTCVSTSATGCVTTGLDAGAFVVQVQYN